MEVAVRCAILDGQWLHVIEMCEPDGPLTASRLILTRNAKSVPEMLTIGNG
jgi:hypothetical protein